MDKAQESIVVAALARFLSHVLVHLPLQRVSRVQAMDKAQESIVVAALARFLSHVLRHMHIFLNLKLKRTCNINGSNILGNC